MAATDLRVGEYGGTTSTVDSGTINALSRQPSVFDFAQTNQFKIYLPIFPTTEWFVVQANVPDISLGTANQSTPFTDISLVGDKPQYGDFSITFMIDEQYKNYMEMYKWIKNIAFPYSRDQFNKLPRPDNIDRSTGSRYRTSTSNIKVTEGEKNLYSDIQLTILSSKNNPVLNVHIYEAFPTSLSSINYSQQETDTTYATCDVTFGYTWFDIEST